MIRIVNIDSVSAGGCYVGDNFIAEVENAQVFSVGCLFVNGSIVVRGMSSGLYSDNVSLQLHNYFTDGDIVIPDGGDVEEGILLWGDKNFGHWIFTYLNRLSILFHRPELLQKPLIVFDQTPTPYLEWLDLMGFHNYFLAADGVRVKKLWVPSVAHYRDETKQVHISPDAVHIFRHFLKRKGGDERIYVSRAKARWRRATNEDELVAMLEKHGIRRVFMEDMSATEQLTLISRCLLVVIVTGGSSPITMLAQRYCKIVEISLPGFSGIFASRGWAEVIGQDYRRMDGVPVEKGINSDFTVDLKELEKLL